MRRPWEEVEKRIAEIEELHKAEYAREERILQARADFYARQEEIEVAGLAPLLKEVMKGPAPLRDFFDAQVGEARRRLEVVTPLLQLSEEELEHINRAKQVVTMLDPCGLVPPLSPAWRCAHVAASCGCNHWETSDASASGACSPAYDDNESNIRAEAFGQGSNGWRYAQAQCWFYFDIPARPAAANVTVYVYNRVHGFHILRTATGSASLRLDLTAEAFQYGFSWGSATKRVVDLSADTMGRTDKNVFLQFMVPVGADPFTVKVTARLAGSAKAGGALSVGDFSTGAGNFIDTVWVNTYG